MTKIIVEVSKYVLLLLMVIFTMQSFIALKRKTEESRSGVMGVQIVLMVVFNFVAYFVMYLQTGDINMILLYGGVVIYILAIVGLYRLLYKNASMMLLNNMCMLLSIGLVIQARLGTSTAVRQLIIASISTVISLIIPVLIRKAKVFRKLTWVYGIVGILLLVAVLGFSKITRGASLSLSIGGITFQFSEFVKITVVFFMAGMLQSVTSFRQVFKVTVIAGIHVVLLVLSRDLGAALIYFVAYIVMVFVATRKARYALLGLGGMAVASVGAYKLFSHIRVRVNVWRDPFADYEGTGYQIVQALFGVCAGGWFGTGLFAGSPTMIPLAKEDFTFAAICEEMGILFAICLILLCMAMFLLIVNIAMKLDKPFYKLVAIGLGAEYAFQVFLTVGGTTKFIPMTGITLPLVSYGGSSVMCTMIMLAIIQGLYIIRKDEDAEVEELRRQKQLEQERRQGRRPEYPAQQPGRPVQQQPGRAGQQSGRPVQQQPGRAGQQSGRPVQQPGSAGDDDLERKIREQTEKSLNW